MAVDVETSIEIAVPLALVSSYAADPENAPEWYANIDSVTWETEIEDGAPVPAGARMAFVAHFLGRRLAYTYEVRDHVPGERLVMSTSQGPFPMETTYTWQRVAPELTRMTLRNRGEPAGFGAAAAPLMAAAMRRANRNDLARLKAILEGTAWERVELSD